MASFFPTCLLVFLWALWLGSKFWHPTNEELDVVVAGGSRTAASLLAKGAAWRCVTGRKSAVRNRWPFWLIGLLLLCGDIEPNPGPCVNLCSVCSAPVEADQHGIYCEVCLNWNHPACVNMSLDDYFQWGKIEDGWVCPRCDREAFPFYDVSQLSSTDCSASAASTNSSFLPTRTHHATQKVSVFYFNARSLLPKIDEVRAICANMHYDLVVVVESWLSAEILDSEIHVPGYNPVRKDRNRHGGGL